MNSKENQRNPQGGMDSVTIICPNLFGSYYDQRNPQYSILKAANSERIPINPTSDTGSTISTKLFDKLNIAREDRDFFGIAIPPIPVENQRHFKWLRDDKLLKKQVTMENRHHLQVALKIFPNSSLRPKDSVGLRKICYLIKNVIKNNLLKVSDDLIITLYALILQSNFGDHRPILDKYASSYHREDILQILSEIDVKFHDLVEEKHISFNKMNSQKAESKFLAYAQKIKFYGIHLFEVNYERSAMSDLHNHGHHGTNNHQSLPNRSLNESIMLGINLEGILFYDNFNNNNNNRNSIPKNDSKSSLIQWRRIQKLKYRDREFLIEYHKPMAIQNSNGDENYQTATKLTIVVDKYKLRNFRLCKDLYFTCIYHHEMFKRTLATGNYGFGWCILRKFWRDFVIIL